MNKIIFSNTDKNDIAEALATLWAYIAVFYRINGYTCHVSRLDEGYYEQFDTAFHELRKSVVKGMCLKPTERFFLKFNELAAGDLYSNIFFDNCFDENVRDVFKPRALTSIGSDETGNVMLEKLRGCAGKMHSLYNVINLSDYVKERYEKTDGNVHISITDSKWNNVIVWNKKYTKVINDFTTTTIGKEQRKFALSKESLRRIIRGDIIDFSFADKELVELLPEIESALRYIEFNDVKQFQIEQKDVVYEALPFYGYQARKPHPNRLQDESHTCSEQQFVL